MSEKKVLSTTMYCSEQIVIPEKISNLLKTYAKAALKTQPYDLLRWSAAYFRCLSEDELPPVKPRYEHENVFGCLTRGYLRALLNQVGNGYFIRRDILEHRWSGLCLPEDELLKFLSITRMLYWPQLHWLKLIAVMVGSLNQNFLGTISMLCELLTDEPEGGSAPVPLWLFRECFKFLTQLDCSETQTFFDGRKMISERTLESEAKMPNVPSKLSSTSFRNAVFEYWKYRIENLEKNSENVDVNESSLSIEESGEKSADEKPIFRSTSSITRDGSVFHITGEFADPHEIIKRSLDFEGIINVIELLKIDDDDDDDNGEIISEMTDEQRQKIAQHRLKFAELKEKLSNNLMMDGENTKKGSIENEFYELLKEIGPPWNWLYGFVDQTCGEKSFNFLEKTNSNIDEIENDGKNSSSEMLKATSKIGAGATSSSIFDDEKSNNSEASGIYISLQNVDDNSSSASKMSSSNKISNHHQVLIETICNIGEASDNGECDISDTLSISKFLDSQQPVLTPSDYHRLKKFIEKAQERGLAFNDLNELYNYFISESACERTSTHDVEVRIDGGDEHENSDDAQVPFDENNEGEEEAENENKNVVAIFGESGIEVDGKLLEAKVSDRMILGLVDKGSDDNLSDVASSVSSVSQAETVKMKNHVTRERNTQTASYREQIHSRRMQNKQQQQIAMMSRKSKSASSIKRQPFVCKIPPLPGIGAAMDADMVDRLLHFLTHRSFVQGGFVYPRNFHEDELQRIITLD